MTSSVEIIEIVVKLTYFTTTALSSTHQPFASQRQIEKIRIGFLEITGKINVTGVVSPSPRPKQPTNKVA
jgi:hypothetical protein